MNNNFNWQSLINEDKEIIEELKNITKNKKEMNKTRKCIKISMWAILTCNFLAGCFIGSIWLITNDLIYLFIGIFIILLDIPIYIILKSVINKIDTYN